MRRALLAVALLVAATALPSSVVTANGNDSDRNHTGFWEAKWPGWTCTKRNTNDATSTTVPSVYDVYRVVLKGGSKFNDGDGFRVILYGVAPGTVVSNPTEGTRTISHAIFCGKDKKRTVKRLIYDGRILGPCGDPFYTARAWNGSKSTRPVTVVLRANGKVVWKRTLQPGQSVKPKPRWYPGGVLLTLRRGNGDLIDRERTVSGTYPWSECRNG